MDIYQKVILTLSGMRNVYNYWTDFLKGKDNMNILIENVLEEDYVLMDELMKRIDEY